MDNRSYIVVGLHFGDEGKGTIVDFLAREKENPIIVKYGGPQAAHNVITPEGKHHTFAQLGSGMFVEGARMVLSADMYIEPLAFMFEHKIFEEKVGRDITKNIFIDHRCRIVTPYHRIAGRLMAKSLGRSTCGMGVGMAVNDTNIYDTSVLVGDIPKTEQLRKKLKQIIRFNKTRLNYDIKFNVKIDDIVKTYEKFYAMYQIVDTEPYLYNKRKNSTIIYEGSQGILLSTMFGFPPHISKATVSPGTMRTRARYIHTDPITIGVMRSYSHRHGCGPVPTEGTAELPELHNTNNEWQGQFRTGMFDPVFLKYVLSTTDINYLAVKVHVSSMVSSSPSPSLSISLL